MVGRVRALGQPVLYRKTLSQQTSIYVQKPKDLQLSAFQRVARLEPNTAGVRPTSSVSSTSRFRHLGWKLKHSSYKNSSHVPVACYIYTGLGQTTSCVQPLAHWAALVCHAWAAACPDRNSTLRLVVKTFIFSCYEWYIEITQKKK